jgi:hypothetical protein
MHVVEIGQSGRKVGGRSHRLAVAMCRVQAIAAAACWFPVTMSYLAKLLSGKGNEYADLIATPMMVLDVIVLATRYTSLTRTPPSFGAPLPSDRRLRQQPC